MLRMYSLPTHLESSMKDVLDFDRRDTMVEVGDDATARHYHDAVAGRHDLFEF